MPRLLLLFSQNVNHSPEFWRLSGRKSHLCPPKSLKMLLIPRFCCQQYSCVKERNLQIAAKLREFDCNVSNRVIVSFLVLFFFSPSQILNVSFSNNGPAILKPYIIFCISWSRSALLSLGPESGSSQQHRADQCEICGWLKAILLPGRYPRPSRLQTHTHVRMRTEANV